MATPKHQAARVGVVCCRVLQGALIAFALAGVVGAFAGNVTIFTFLAVALLVLILLAFVFVVELVAMALRRVGSDSPDP